MRHNRLYEAVCRRLLELDLGSVQFSPNRIDGASREEPNTPEEDALFDDLRDWVGSSSSASAEVRKKIKDLMSDPEYSDFFKSPVDVEAVHRGMSVSKNQLADWLGKKPTSIDRSGTVEVDFEVSPQAASGMMSWSKDEAVSHEFSGSTWIRKPVGDYAVVVSARVGDNSDVLFDLDSVARKVKGLPKIAASEQEVVSLGPIKCFRVTWDKI